MLPEPNLTFTIPSIHDDVTTLECRVYHPQSLAASPHSPPWRRHAAVIAHPYASLGGCYDDAVVETLASTLLRQGYVVGTFNFRGAGKSTGKTSWTSKAERGDYISFAAFVYYYCHYLDPFRPQGESKSPVSLASSVSSPTLPTATTDADSSIEATTAESSEPPVLLLCGYSYGAMVTKLLPPVHTMLEPFATPKTASAAADIRLRAQHLAGKQNNILASARASLAEDPMSPRKAAFGMRVGGDEDSRRSQEHGGRRSFSLDAEDKIKKGVAELMQRAKSGQLHHHHHRKKKAGFGESDMPVVKEEDESETREKEADVLPPVAGLMAPRVAYLLVSPPVGWATSFLTLNMGGSMSNLFAKRPKSPRSKDKGGPSTSQSPESSEVRQEKLQKLVDNPTLVIYGDADLFVSAKRFREWAAKLQTAPGSRFRAHEVSTAGHFYVEEGTMQKLADAVGVFSGELLSSGT